MERQTESDLTGKVAIVTGASRGIGRQAALALARRGVDIVIAARATEERQTETLPGTIGETAEQVESVGARALAVATDLSKEDDLHRLVDAAIERFGGVDILVNNGAVTRGHSWAVPIEDMPREDWLYQFAVNVHAPFTLIQRVVPTMAARGGGRILNVSSGSAEAFRQVEERVVESVGDYSLAAPGYFATKRALDRFSNVIAPQLARKNIFIVSMHPGFVASENAQQLLEEAGMDGRGIVPMAVPARMLAYFAACDDPREYTGRLFWAEREMAALGIEVDEPLPA